MVLCCHLSSVIIGDINFYLKPECYFCAFDRAHSAADAGEKRGNNNKEKREKCHVDEQPWARLAERHPFGS